MTACVNRKHSRRVAAAVSASLVGALTLGAAPAVVMAQPEAGVEQQFVERLRAGAVRYIPIRHHSPACARAVAEVIGGNCRRISNSLPDARSVRDHVHVWPSDSPSAGFHTVS